MRTIVRLLSPVLLAAGLVHAAEAAILVSDGTQVANRDNVTGTVGTRFTIGAANVAVNALGFEDADLDFLNTSHQVGLWDSGGMLLASITVPAGSGGTLIERWRYALLPGTVTLLAGMTYVLGGETMIDSGDAWSDSVESGGTNPFALGAGILDANPTNVFSLGAFAFPNNDGTATDLRWGPANATFLNGTPLAAPATLILFAAVVLGLAAARRLRPS